MRRRLPFKEIFNRRMKQLKLHPTEMQQRALEKGVKLKTTTVKKGLTDTKNPGIYTVEAYAIGMGMKPLEFMAECLGESTDYPLLKQKQFKNLEDIYKEMTLTQKQKADAFIGGLELQLRHIKNEPK